MKDGLRFVDSDMHIMEPPDLFERYLDPKFRHRVLGPIGADGKPKRGTSAQTIIDGLPGTGDADMQQYRKRAEGRRHPEHAAALGLAAGRHRPSRFRDRARTTTPRRR